jgi:hypothetical protein
MKSLCILIVCLWRVRTSVALGSRYCVLMNFICRRLACLLHEESAVCKQAFYARQHWLKIYAHTYFHIPGAVRPFHPSFRKVTECTWLRLRSHSDRPCNLYLDQLWPYNVLRWVGHVAFAGVMRGTCRFGSMKGRYRFGDVDVGGSLIQCGTNLSGYIWHFVDRVSLCITIR